jgi:hypothetical protein
MDNNANMKLGIPWKTGHAVAKTGDTSFALLLININANMKLGIQDMQRKKLGIPHSQYW